MGPEGVVAASGIRSVASQVEGGVDLFAGHLLAVEEELNNRPRLVLNGRTPADRFATLLASTTQWLLRR